MTRPSQRREMAETAGARHGVSLALAWRAFGVSQKVPGDEEIAAALFVTPQVVKQRLNLAAVAHVHPFGAGTARMKRPTDIRSRARQVCIADTSLVHVQPALRLPFVNTAQASQGRMRPRTSASRALGCATPVGM